MSSSARSKERIQKRGCVKKSGRAERSRSYCTPLYLLNTFSSSLLEEEEAEETDPFSLPFM